jgi:hypothetical protein
MAIFDQIAEGGYAGFKGLAIGGVITLGAPIATRVIGNAIEMAGDALRNVFKGRASVGDALGNIFRKFSRQARCWWRNRACFTAETLIYTKEGHEPIKDIKVGDEVYSEHVETGEKGFKRVKEVFVRETNVLIHLFLDDVKITTTPEHPFWVPEKGWVPAGKLQVEDHVKLYSGIQAAITSIRQKVLTRPIKVYNLKVEGWHTYFVSEHNILVHNIDCGDVLTFLEKLKSQIKNLDCMNLSRIVHRHFGELGGKKISLLPKHGGVLPTVGELPKDWDFHTAIKLDDGRVLDPLQETIFPSEGAFRKAIVGNAEVETIIEDFTFLDEVKMGFQTIDDQIEYY